MDTTAIKNTTINAEGSLWYLSVITTVAALGGFLFGFDTAVISGALSPLIIYFKLQSDPVLQGWIVSSILLGSVIGAAVSGYLADKYGRKNTLLLSAFLFLISALASALVSSFSLFVCARLAGGLAVGIAAMVAPLYISEIAPPRIRGRMVAMYQLAITIGVLIAYLTNQYLGELSKNVGSEHANPTLLQWMFQDIWRAMLGSEALPALLFLILLFFVPRSPRFMVLIGKENEAQEIISRVSGPAVASKEIEEIKKAIAGEKGSVRDLFMPGLRKATYIALFLSIFSQFSGIDIVLHYGPVILERAGFSFEGSLYGQIVFGVVLVIFTILAMWKVDHLGRKSLLLWGNTGIFLSLCMMGYFFKTGIGSELGLLIVISVFIASFAFSLGPIPWIIMSEIFPTRLRGRAMAIATMVLFAANWLVAQLFPVMSAAFGEHGTFWILAVFTLPTFFFVWKILPETKGRTLEELESSWAS